MNAVILRLHWLLLKRDRPALVLSFILPIVFFSVFSAVYLEIAGDGATRILRVGIVDLDRSEASQRLISGLKNDRRLQLQEIAAGGETPDAARDQATQLVRSGAAPVALILEPGFGDRLGTGGGGPPAVRTLEDRSDAPLTVTFDAVLDAALTRLAAEFWAMRGMDALRTAERGYGAASAGAIPGPQQVTASLAAIRAATRIERIDVLGGSSAGRKRAAIAYFAAGTGVLFLLFTMAGAAATLLDEVRDGTLQRVLGGGLGLTQLLLYKWIFFVALGAAQVTVMFLWGWAVFGLDLFTFPHLSGFVVMTFFTSAAAAAFGIAMATLCSSRAQFTGFSTILILVMSAVGGSMFPRFLMSDTLKSAGLATFNAWALDGYQKVFWYEAPLHELWPQILVLAVCTVVLMAVARRLAARWATS